MIVPPARPRRRRVVAVAHAQQHCHEQAGHDQRRTAAQARQSAAPGAEPDYGRHETEHEEGEQWRIVVGLDGPLRLVVAQHEIRDHRQRQADYGPAKQGQEQQWPE